MQKLAKTVKLRRTIEITNYFHYQSVIIVPVTPKLNPAKECVFPLTKLSVERGGGGGGGALADFRMLPKTV